jgi:hypothetical protein
MLFQRKFLLTILIYHVLLLVVYQATTGGGDVKVEDLYYHLVHHHLQHSSKLHLSNNSHSYHELLSKETSQFNFTCSTDPDQYPGILSKAEFILQKVFHKTLHRQPSMKEREVFYNYLKTGEISAHEIHSYINQFPKDSQISDLHQFPELFPWSERMKNKVYAWTVDFHPSPAGCNLGIYESIGVVLHPEVDHHPFCEYYGLCRQRMNKIFGLGADMVGFALDPDYTVLKSDFYELYRNDSEFQRIDLFMCSHPAANCELFEQFGKPMIMFFTTRLEFGRHDLNIGWRVREVRKWNSWGELEFRERELVELIHRNYLIDKIFLVANNPYDAEYVYYFTGLRPKYIPSWCGDADNSWGLKSTWMGCQIDESQYQPTSKDILIVPYKQPLWMMKNKQPDTNHKLYQQLQKAQQDILSEFPSLTEQTLPSVKHSLQAEIENHRAEVYKLFPALIFIPYQTSVMSFFEFYRLNIPMFAPSLSLLVEWNADYEILSSRIYGWPKRELEIIQNFSCQHLHRFCKVDDPDYVTFQNIPNPNSKNNDLNSTNYWLKYSDIYYFPHIQYFDNFTHFYHQLLQVNLTNIHHEMMEANRERKISIAKDWDEVFAKAVPHRERGKFEHDQFIPNPH